MYAIWLPLSAIGLYVMMLVLRSRRRRTVVLKKVLAAPAFDLVELNAMLASEKISQEEFERLREIIMRQQVSVQEGAGEQKPSKSHGFEVVFKENPPK
jgi:hypothetical protein